MSHCTCPNCGVALMITAGSGPSRPAQRDLPLRQQPQPQRRPGNPPGAPMNAERAAGYLMPFGKHKDLTLAEIARVDPEYIGWGAAKFDRGLGQAFTFMAGLMAARDAEPQADRQAQTESAMASGAY